MTLILKAMCRFLPLMAMVPLLAALPSGTMAADVPWTIERDLRSGQYSQALAALAALPASQHDPVFWSQVAVASNRLGDWPTGFRAANLCIRLGLPWGSCYFERGLAAYGLRNFKQAQADFSRCCESGPEEKNPGLAILAGAFLAVIEGRQGHLQEAQASLQKLRSGLQKQSAESATVEWAFGQLDRVKAVGPEPEPADAGTWLARAVMFNAMEDWTEAHRAAQMALALGSRRPVCRLERGLAAYGLKNYAEAEGDLLAYLAAEPKHVQALTTLALAQTHLGRFDQARANLREARALQPTAAATFDYDLSLVDAREGRLVRAQDRLRKNLANPGADHALLRRSEMALLSRLQSADAAEQGARIEAIIDAKDICRAARISPRPAQ